MYRQVRVTDADSRFQRAFWREDPKDPLKVFELSTMTYGTASAPFLATRALKQLAIDERERFPEASRVVEHDFYVDDHPEDLADLWVAYRDALPSIAALRIPRCVVSTATVRVELHGFSDASILAYGACVYLRSIQADGSVRMQLLCSKSKIAPKLKISIPPDIVSRGQLAEDLGVKDLWWHGPKFLQVEDYHTPQAEELSDADLPELRNVVHAAPVIEEMLPVFTKFSSFRKLQRVVAYVLRFVNNARQRDPTKRSTSETATIPEMRAAMTAILRVIQHAEYGDEIERIQEGGLCKSIENLSPIYENGHLRVGGRLQKSNLSYDGKHQVILPHKNPVVKLLVRAIHQENLHVGQAGLVPARTGVDFAGPVAPAFIAALQRFVSRRGVPERIHSDNGLNFVGANHELHDLFELFKKQQTVGLISEFCQPREIEWEFIPPRAPHFGGLWEANVKCVKSHLKKILRTTSLNFEEFTTLLAQIEAILNSRPLLAQPSDPNDPSVLTPGHFLISRELTSIPEPSYENVPCNRLSRWQYIQLLRQHFWRRWSNEYLNQLQGRAKWRTKKPNIKKDAIVIVKEDNTPVQSWKMGKIVNTYPGEDAAEDPAVRVVDVQVAENTYRRPISKICPLPDGDGSDTSTATVIDQVLPPRPTSEPPRSQVLRRSGREHVLPGKYKDFSIDRTGLPGSKTPQASIAEEDWPTDDNSSNTENSTA